MKYERVTKTASSPQAVLALLPPPPTKDDDSESDPFPECECHFWDDLFTADAGRDLPAPTVEAPPQPAPRSAEVMDLTADSDDEPMQSEALPLADCLIRTQADGSYDHLAHQSMFQKRRKKDKNGQQGDGEDGDDQSKKGKKGKKGKTPKKTGKKGIKGNIRLRGKQAAPAAALHPAPAAAPVPVHVAAPSAVNMPNIDVDLDKKRWLLSEYPHVRLSMFQGFLAKAAKLCDTSGARKYESKVAVSFQRLQWHFQVLDVEDKRAQCAFTDKNRGEIK